MNPIKVFNPEHDMALSNGDRHFIAPKNIREMAHDLAPLLDVMNSEQFIVWGWDHALKTRLLRMGIAADMLPTDTALTALRTCSERKTAHQLLTAFRSNHPDDPYTGESIIAQNIDEIATYATLHGHIILKDPLSSSGKGLRHVNMNEGGLPLPPSQRGGTEGMSSLSSSLSKVENWANALIKRYGYLTAEPYYEKKQDFAMEFCIRDGKCYFIGYSLFNTNHHGRYESNLLMTDEKIEGQLAQYIPHSTLHEVQAWVISHSDLIIPTEWNTTKLPLYFGIDMMIVKTANNRLQTEENSEFALHPCVEINLRLNMGIVSHEAHQKLLAPKVEGTFHVTSFPSEEAAQQFYKEHTEQYPTIYQGKRLFSGYFPLTPIYPHTRHHAYIIAQPISSKESFI